MREELAERHSAEGAEHEQRAMGEIDDAERAEHERQAERDQRIGGALVEPVEELQKDDFEHRVLRPTSTVAEIPRSERRPPPETGPWSHAQAGELRLRLRIRRTAEPVLPGPSSPPKIDGS